MKLGLTGDELMALEKTVIQPLKKAGFKVYAFGSRVTGKNHPFSDLDLLLCSPHQSPEAMRTLSYVRELIEEARFPFRVDFVLEDELALVYRERVFNERIEI